MQTLKVISNIHDLPNRNSVIDIETGGTKDKIACMLTYLRSLEQNAEKVHGDNDDWRYGRYLVYKAMIAALRSEEMQSA